MSFDSSQRFISDPRQSYFSYSLPTVLSPQPVPAGGQTGIISETVLQNKQIEMQLNPEGNIFD